MALPDVAVCGRRSASSIHVLDSGRGLCKFGRGSVLKRTIRSSAPPS